MADRRCFHRKIVESDQFYRLPASAQSLYFHLNMASDDDGFVIGAESITSRSRTGKTDLKKLVEERFVLKFGEIYVIKHWRVSNSLKNDRSKPLTYPGVAAKIWVKSNRGYTDHPVEGCKTLYETKTGAAPPDGPPQNSYCDPMESNWNPNGIQPESEWNPNGILTEPNRTEPNRTEPNRREADAVPAWFPMVWESYPDMRKGDRKAAENAAMEIRNEDGSRILESLDAWKRSEQWLKSGGQYVPYLVNWLKNKRWQIMPDPAPGTAPRALDEDEMEAIRRMMEEDPL